MYEISAYDDDDDHGDDDDVESLLTKASMQIPTQRMAPHAFVLGNYSCGCVTIPIQRGRPLVICSPVEKS